MRLGIPLTLATVLGLAGCQTGHPPIRDRMALSAAGAQISLYVDRAGRALRGELLEARLDSITLLASGRVARIAVSSVFELSVPDYGLYVQLRRAMPAEELAHLKLMARYPYGIPERVMPALLASTGQATIDVVLPSPP